MLLQIRFKRLDFGQNCRQNVGNAISQTQISNSPPPAGPPRDPACILTPTHFPPPTFFRILYLSLCNNGTVKQLNYCQFDRQDSDWTFQVGEKFLLLKM